jgi:hypothetical protein
MTNFTISKMFCTECGNEGTPIPRKNGQQREPGHLKNLYCIHCKKETNHAEVRPFGAYDEEDFREEFELGRFVNGERIEIKDLQRCPNSACEYYVEGKCWNANHSFQCRYREKGEC